MTNGDDADELHEERPHGVLDGEPAEYPHQALRFDQDAAPDNSWDVQRLLDGHLAAGDPEASLEDLFLDILDHAQVHTRDGNVTVVLGARSEEFSSLDALRLFLRSLRWAVIPDLGRIQLYYNHGERVPGALVDNALAHSGVSAVLPKGPAVGSVLLYSIEKAAPTLVLPAADIVVVNTELIKFLARHPDLVYELDPRKFEELVAEIFRDLGYDTMLTPKSKDGGRDIRAIRNDAAGTFLYLIECKRWAKSRPVGVEIVRGLYGVVAAERATCGIVATTSRFTSGAKAFASQVRYQMSLRDFGNLREWLADYRGPTRS